MAGKKVNCSLATIAFNDLIAAQAHHLGEHLCSVWLIFDNDDGFGLCRHEMTSWRK
jgi:hypothetical protein